MRKLIIISLLFIASNCFGQITGSAKSYWDLSVEERLQRSVDSLNWVTQYHADSISTELYKNAFVNLLATAKSSEGVSVGNLTAAQVRALAAILFFNNGAIDSSLKIRPIDKWAQFKK